MATSTAQKYEEKKGKEKYDKEYWMSYTKEKFEESRNWRGSNVELQWFVNYMYYKGNQNLKFDRTTGTFIKKNPFGEMHKWLMRMMLIIDWENC